MVTFGSHVGNHQFQPFLSGVYAGVIPFLWQNEASMPGASDDSTFQLSDGSWVQFKDIDWRLYYPLDMNGLWATNAWHVLVLRASKQTCFGSVQPPGSSAEVYLVLRDKRSRTYIQTGGAMARVYLCVRYAYYVLRHNCHWFLLKWKP